MSNNGTNVRTVFFILSWINTFAATQGWYHIPHISEEGVSIFITLIVTAWGFYKNNNFTKESKIAQTRLDSLKEK